jgi:hypothetical protein
MNEPRCAMDPSGDTLHVRFISSLSLFFFWLHFLRLLLLLLRIPWKS